MTAGGTGAIVNLLLAVDVQVPGLKAVLCVYDVCQLLGNWLELGTFSEIAYVAQEAMFVTLISHPSFWAVQ